MQIFKGFVTILDVLFVLLMLYCGKGEKDKAAKVGLTAIVVLLVASVLAIWL